MFQNKYRSGIIILNKKNIPKKLSALLIIFILLVFFLPPHSTQAADPVTGFLSYSFELIVSKITVFFLGLAGNAISWLASLVDSFIQYQTNSGVYGVFVVDQSWKIIRNFVNMFFILVLIIMAFGTIFGMEKYSYRQMLGPFLIAALLVNFSLAIGKYIITFANGLSSIFLKQMGSLSANFVQGTSLAKLVTNDSALKLAGDIVGAGPNIAISAVFSVVLLVVALIALLAIAIFTVARLFMLWFLLIISPIAWIGYSFPLLRQRTWNDWWKNFLCWCFFLPYYLFFMLFALMFIQNKDNSALKISDSSQTLVGLSANDFLFYSLSIVFMVGGLGIAKKLACASGTGVAKVFGAIEGTVGGYVKRTTGYTGLKKGLQAKSEEVLEKGAFGIPGLQAGRIREAKLAEKFSFGALRGEADKVRLVETNKESEKIRQAIQAMAPAARETYLRQEMAKSGTRGNAAALELSKQGYSNLNDYKAAMEKFGGEYTSLGREYLKSIKEAKFSRVFSSTDEEARIAKGEHGALEYLELRRALAQDLAEKNRVTNKPDFDQFKDLFTAVPKELRTFMNAIKPEFIYATRQARQAAIVSGELDSEPDLARKLIEFMKDKKEISAQRDGAGNIISGSDIIIRDKVLEILGGGDKEDGKNTIEGRSVINEIDKFNPVINIRADNPTLVGQALIGKIFSELEKKAPEDISKFSPELFEDPEAREAIKNLVAADVWDGDFLKQVTDKASSKVKSHIKAIKNEVYAPPSPIIIP